MIISNNVIPWPIVCNGEPPGVFWVMVINQHIYCANNKKGIYFKKRLMYTNRLSEF